MRITAIVATTLLFGAGLIEPAQAQRAIPLTTGTVGAGPAAAAPAAPGSCAHRPNALGVARIVEIDTTGGPGFGFEHFKIHDFLREGEVVLTFDDGPWPNNTPAVLAALAAIAPRRPSSRSASTPPTSRTSSSRWRRGPLGRLHTWSHTNLRRSRARRQGRDREGHERGALGAPAYRRRRSSASRRCGTRRSSSPIWASAMSRSSRPTSIRSISRCASRTS